MKSPLILFLFLASLNVFSQDLILSGKIIDANTTETIPFANIRTQKKGAGTVSNEHGEFELHLPQSANKDTLIVSCIGYNYLAVSTTAKILP